MNVPFKKDAPIVSLHPLVIINVSDHYTRIKANGTDSNPFVYGALLGTREGGQVEVFDAFECILNEEGAVNLPALRERLTLNQDCFKVLGKTYELLGWYCTGSEISERNHSIHREFLRETDGDASILLMLDAILAANTKKDLPIFMFEHEMKLGEDGTSRLSFGRIPFKVETDDAERVSVDHVAHAGPSGNDGSSTAAHLDRIQNATKMLTERVGNVIRYVKAVQDGSVPVDHEMLRQIKSLCHMLPAMDTVDFRSESLTEYNDNLLQIYLATLMKNANKLNDLVDHHNASVDRMGRMRFAGMER